MEPCGAEGRRPAHLHRCFEERRGYVPQRDRGGPGGPADPDRTSGWESRGRVVNGLNPKVAGSTPAPATNKYGPTFHNFRPVLICAAIIHDAPVVAGPRHHPTAKAGSAAGRRIPVTECVAALPGSSIDGLLRAIQFLLGAAQQAVVMPEQLFSAERAGEGHLPRKSPSRPALAQISFERSLLQRDGQPSQAQGFLEA